ncbi:uncharacterized protein LOC127594764 [Hippocampus zosterae]|uniref:uncharacterized protein LOC127594764 n=1 Tax=Hippocampus zosterae TaxID=109293 RepID=UPI00223CBF3D|nr:uncharacterized protein LOC127594764 [Hippocampus zosterae]
MEVEWARATSNEANVFMLSGQKKKADPCDAYSQLVAKQLQVDGESRGRRIVNLREGVPTTEPAPQPKRICRVGKSAVKVLDAPELKNDYYLNLLDWSSEDILLILLGHTSYMYTPAAITALDTWEDGYLCSVASLPGSPVAAIGGSNGLVRVYDQARGRPIRQFEGHGARVSSLAFAGNLLFSGGKDGLVHGYDLRQEHCKIMTLQGHQGEVCGLKADQTQLASGSNDNRLIIWDVRQQTYRHAIHAHRAAVKALAFCPWQRNLLVSGGGSSDMQIKFWNTDSGELAGQAETDSQVCSLLWCQHERRLLSSHGYVRNHLSLWDVSHAGRVLHLAMNPQGTMVCSASAD